MITDKELEVIERRSARFMARLAGEQEGSAGIAAQLSAMDVPDLLAAVKELAGHLREIDNTIGVLREAPPAGWGVDPAADEAAMTGPPSPLQRMRRIAGIANDVHRGEKWRRIVSDLDRCPHGRHEGDTCGGWRGPGLYDGGCRDGYSMGNPLYGACAVIGVDLYGRIISVPEERADRSDPAKWVNPARPGELLHHHLPGHVGDDVDFHQDPPAAEGSGTPEVDRE